MREVRIKVPEGDAQRFIHFVQELGAERVGVYREFVHGPDRWEEVVSIETSTPDAARIVDALERAPFFNAETHTFTIRELRSISSRASIRDVTVPIALPQKDVTQDLWQFSQVTYGHVGRVAIAALLLSYALIRGSTLLLIGGLLFLPGLPHLLAIGRGACARDHRLALQGALALATTIAILIACGAFVAALVAGPMRFDDFLSPAVGVCVSSGIGIAGALASLDDVGKRELIGLATAAQVGVVPAWFGVSLVHGLDAVATVRVASYLVNLAVIVIAAASVYTVVGLHRRRDGKRAPRPSDAKTPMPRVVRPPMC